MAFFTRFFGELVGADAFGNRYYRRKRSASPERRWVLYAGLAEPSKVPPLWFGWLHHTASAPPTKNVTDYPWERPHKPNLTGTLKAYSPPKVSAAPYYAPWNPERPSAR